MRSCSLLVAFLVLIPLYSQAQTSVGFSDPEQTQNLLDYRLPDWSYRVWDAQLALDGSSSEDRYNSESSFDSDLSSNVGTSFLQNREGENRSYYLRGDLSGIYQKNKRSSDYESVSQKNIEGFLDLWASGKQHLAQGPLFVSLGARANRAYLDDFFGRQRGESMDEEQYITRYRSHTLSAGLGYGRVRNVGPLLKSQRLNERIQALGRPELSDQQIQEVARVLASEYAYRQVFDRSDKYLWDKVLAPMLEGQPPLSPFEIMYLTDVLSEDHGSRFEGWNVELLYEWKDFGRRSENHSSYATRYRPQLAFQWSHNPSLNHQFRVWLMVDYSWENRNVREVDEGDLSLEFEYLWDVADRFHWTNRIRYYGNLAIPEYPERHNASLQSSLRFFIEDQLSLIAGVDGSHYWRKEEFRTNKSLDFTYSLGLQYHIDRVLFN